MFGRKLIIPLIFIAGFSLFFYPFISHWWKTKNHYEIMRNYDYELEKMTEDDRLAQLKEAEKYNQSIHTNGIPIYDPFSEDAEDATVNKSYFNVMKIEETMGHLEIPKINVHLPIYHGIGEKVLSQGVGHMSNSSLPIGGSGTHSALTAHRGLPSTKLFRDLDQVKEGDVFFIHSLGETLAYRVDDIQIVLPSETEWLDIDENKDYATLITCEPYMINTHRLLVRGERVPYDDSLVTNRSDYMMEKEARLLGMAKEEAEDFYKDPIVLSSLAFTVLAFSLIILVIKRRRRFT